MLIRAGDSCYEQVNVLGSVYPTRAVITGMKKKKAGRIVFVASQVAQVRLWGVAVPGFGVLQGCRTSTTQYVGYPQQRCFSVLIGKYLAVTVPVFARDLSHAAVGGHSRLLRLRRVEVGAARAGRGAADGAQAVQHLRVGQLSPGHRHARCVAALGDRNRCTAHVPVLRNESTSSL